MKKNLTAALAALALAVMLAPSAAEAGGYTYNDTAGYAYLYDTGFVTSTAITTGAFDASKLDFLEVEFTTAAEGATRSLIPECLNADDEQLYAFPTTSVAAEAQVRLVFDPDVTTTANVPTGTTVYSVKPCSRMRVGAALGSGDAAMRVSGRKRSK